MIGLIENLQQQVRYNSESSNKAKYKLMQRTIQRKKPADQPVSTFITEPIQVVDRTTKTVVSDDDDDCEVADEYKAANHRTSFLQPKK